MFGLEKLDEVLQAGNSLKREEVTPDTCGLPGILRDADGSHVSTYSVDSKSTIVSLLISSSLIAVPHGCLRISWTGYACKGPFRTIVGIRYVQRVTPFR